MCDIETYIKDKTNLNVNLEKINMKLPKDYDVYKVFVPKSKTEVFLEDDFWPEGVAYRRFVDFYQDTTRSTHRELEKQTGL